MDGKELEEVKKFKYLGSMITGYGYCETEIRRKILLAKVEFNTHAKALLTKRFDRISKKR